MVFKGTATLEPGDVFRKIESYGGKINAFTSYDYTGYKVTVPAEFAFPALEILAEMVMKATFEKEEFKREKKVILKEIRLNYDDPQRYASRLLWQSAYTVHPYKYPILGEEELFNRLSREDLLEFHQETYVPNNMVLAIVGDIETGQALNFARDCFKNFPRKPVLDSRCEPEPEQEQLRKRETRFTAGLTYLLLGYHSVAITDEDCFALDVLGAILGEGESSRLYRLICSKKRLAYSIEAANYTPLEPGLFIIFCQLEEPRRRRVLSLIFDQIRLVGKKLVPEEELERAKNKLISDILFATQTVEAQARDMALNEVLTEDFRFTERYIQKIKEVDAQDIQRVAKRYLLEDNLNIVALIPREGAVRLKRQKSPGGSLSIGIENLSKETEELHGSKSEINPVRSFGKEGLVASNGVKKYVLDNGITLLIKENRDLPLVSIKAVFKGGLRAEDENTNGLCNLVAQMLDKGTRSRNSAEIAYLVESRGAHLSSFSGNNSFGISLDLLSEDFDQMLPLLADLLINSVFPQSEIRRQKQRCLARIKACEDDIFDSGTRLLKETLFRKHPYRFLTLGNEKSLKKLRRRDLLDFYRNFCVGENMVLSIFGDVNGQQIPEKVNGLFKGIKSAEAPSISAQKEPKDKSLRTSSKPLPKRQTLALMGFGGVSVFNEDRFVLELLCQILSSASGRLFTQIRERPGLAYTLGAYQVLGLDPGYLVIYVATTRQFVETVKEEILHQLHLLKQEPLSEEELLRAKRALLGRKLIDRQTNSACAMESSLDELYGLGRNYYLGYAGRINQIEAADITRCARRYFDLSNYAVVVIGP